MILFHRRSLFWDGFVLLAFEVLHWSIDTHRCARWTKQQQAASERESRWHQQRRWKASPHCSSQIGSFTLQVDGVQSSALSVSTMEPLATPAWLKWISFQPVYRFQARIINFIDSWKPFRHYRVICWLSALPNPFSLLLERNKQFARNFRLSLATPAERIVTSCPIWSPTNKSAIASHFAN